MNEIAQQETTLYRLTDDISAYFESREMVTAQLADPQEDGDRATLKGQLTEIDAQLARLGTELATKTDCIAGVLRRMSTEQDALKEEQERIHARRKTFERAEKWLRDYTVSVMRQRGIPQIKTQNNTLFIRQSDAVIVENAASVPVDYKNVAVKMPAWLWGFMCDTTRASGSEFAKELESLRVTEEISLSTIKKAIKSGVSVQGADIEFHDSLVLR